MIGKNNVLNIRSTSSRWKGKIGSNYGFCVFDSVDSCIRVGLYLLERTYYKRGIKSIRDIIYTFAPPEDCNNTKLYLNYVCSRAGVSSDRIFSTLMSGTKYKVIAAMCMVETEYRLSYEVFIEVYNHFKNEK